MKKTIPELRKELRDAEIRNEYYLGKQEARRLKKQIFNLKHPSVQRIKKASNTFTRTSKQMGATVGRKLINQAKIIANAREIEKNNYYGERKRNGKSKIVYRRKLVKTKKGYYRPRYVAVKIKVKGKKSSGRSGGGRDIFGNRIDTNFIGGGL